MKKALRIFLVVFVGVYLLAIPALANSTNMYTQQPTGVASDDPNIAYGLYNSSNNQVVPFASFLIAEYSMSFVNTGGRSVAVYGSTSAWNPMGSLGFTSISIQRWNGSSWETEITLGSDLVSDRMAHMLGKTATVQGGYYYKATLNHYAKEPGLFGGTQSIFNESSYIFIP